jgi:hypothetical protein
MDDIKLPDEEIPHFRRVYEQRKSQRQVELSDNADSISQNQSSFEISPFYTEDDSRFKVMGSLMTTGCLFLLTLAMVVIAYNQDHDSDPEVTGSTFWVIAGVLTVPLVYFVFRTYEFVSRSTSIERVNMLSRYV